ncbi:uncharacterized protein VTP21DRAFT_11390 [Calcarisporiella thermophila]|uniref:uncharacterized protein n=1 Tax=Calcarisporiella thermophila TaxID=911321 RepID=UPI0037429D2A
MNVDSEEFGTSASKRKRIDKIIVEYPNNLDLDTYIANYKGHTKIDRLIFIAERCPPLRIDAYSLALKEIKETTYDVQKYTQTLQRLNEARGVETESAEIKSWAETTQRRANQLTEKLEQELRTYKNNSIRESIRMGHNDLGDHFYKCGDLTNALKCYMRTRDYCTTPKHVIEMCLNVIKVSIELGNFSHINNYGVKAESTPDVQEKALIQAKLRASSALAFLDNSNYKQAARALLEIPFSLGFQYNEVIAPNDIAIYGGLCALATFDRAELKTKVIDSTEFKQYLELEPQIRELILGFYNSKYTACLEILENWKNDLLLDLHLSSHVDKLYTLIRKKALIQYFTPFTSVDLRKMATAFNTTVSLLERELAALIMDNQIQGRIDSHNKVLHARKQDLRGDVFRQCFAMANEYERAARAMLLRINLIKADLVVKPQGRERDDF